MKNEHIKIKLADSETIVDSFEGVTVTWKYHSQQQNQRRASNDGDQEKTYMELIFDKNYKDIIFNSYLPFIIKISQEIKNQSKAVQLHSLQYGRHRKGVNLDHPSTFERLAMDQNIQKEIMDDLDLFLKRRDFYKKVKKAWKRGYLLYGPPGTMKSSLIVAMANYLKFDIYELQLMHVHGDASLRELLLQTSNRSILVIEDIDCSTLSDQNGTALSNRSRLDYSKDHHWRFEEINYLIKCKKVTPAEVVEELMKSDNVEVVLERVVKFLKRKRIEEAENSEINEAIDEEDNGIRKAKKVKVIS
ncbi:AAA+ ATPase domain-containing protein [Tanacetum coccineum]